MKNTLKNFHSPIVNGIGIVVHYDWRMPGRFFFLPVQWWRFLRGYVWMGKGFNGTVRPKIKQILSYPEYCLPISIVSLRFHEFSAAAHPDTTHHKCANVCGIQRAKNNILEKLNHNISSIIMTQLLTNTHRACCPWFLHGGEMAQEVRAVIWQSEGCRFDPTLGMSKCPWARHLTPNCSWRAGWYLAWQPIAVGVWVCVWMGEWEASIVQRFG